MAKELFIQEYKLLSLFSEKACMIIDSDNRIIDILATESLRLQRKQVIEGMYPSYIPILVRMIMIDPTNELIWLVDESCGTNKVYKDKISIPGGHAEYDYDLAHESPLGLFVNNIGRELAEEFIGDKYETPLQCDIYNVADIPRVLNYIGFTCDSDIDVKLQYLPNWGISVLFFAECHPTLSYKRNAIPFSSDEYDVIKDLYRDGDDILGKERAARYLEDTAKQDIRLKTGRYREMLNSLFNYIKSNY